MVTLQKLTEALRRRGLGDSLSTISAVLKVPESTLRGWLRCAEQLGLDYSKARLLNDAEFKALRRKKADKNIVQPDWAEVLLAVKRPGGSIQAQYEVYCHQDVGKPHMKRSAFYTRFEFVEKSADVETKRLFLHNAFRPAAVAMIDYSGNGIEGIDKDGKRFVGQVFVGVLGCSGYIFCHVTPRQTREDWFESIRTMFEFFEGVTEELWLDNSTPLVRRPDRIDPIISEEFRNMCAHYRTTAIAVPPGEPTYKGLAENAVKQVQRFILQPLKGQRFFTIEAMNKAVLPLLEQLNQRPLTLNPGQSRASRYLKFEKDFLIKLPFIPYNLNVKLIHRRVQTDGRIRIENLRYEVPWGYAGCDLLIAVDYKAGTFTMYRKDTHSFVSKGTLRTPKQGDEPTRIDYLPEELKTSAMNREQLMELIKKTYGESAVALAQIFARHSNSMASKHLRGMISEAKRHSPEAFEEICQITLSKLEVTYATFKKVCASYRHKQATSSDKPAPLPACSETDVRGPEYYKNDGESHEK